MAPRPKVVLRPSAAVSTSTDASDSTDKPATTNGTPRRRLNQLLGNLTPTLPSPTRPVIGTLKLGGVRVEILEVSDTGRVPKLPMPALDSAGSGDGIKEGGDRVLSTVIQSDRAEQENAEVDTGAGLGGLLDLRNGWTLDNIHWMLQKYCLGQDMFLVSQPGGPYARRLALTFARLINAEYEYIALHRDIGETELKQGREIRNGGNLVYVDSPCVNAVKHGRLLILEGIEKAERGIMPVLNNLLENREMNLDDGTHIIHSHRYSQLDSTSSSLSNLFIPAHKNFRVIAISAPVPPYPGYPLDPPFRSRFQSRFIDPVSASLALCDTLLKSNLGQRKERGLKVIQGPNPFATGNSGAKSAVTTFKQGGASSSTGLLYDKIRDLILSTQYASEARDALSAISPSALPPFPQTALSKLYALFIAFPVHPLPPPAHSKSISVDLSDPPSSNSSTLANLLTPTQLGRLFLTIHPALLHAPFQAWALLSRQCSENGIGELGSPILTRDLPEGGEESERGNEEETGLLGYKVWKIEKLDASARDAGLEEKHKEGDWARIVFVRAHKGSEVGQGAGAAAANQNFVFATHIVPCGPHPLLPFPFHQGFPLSFHCSPRFLSLLTTLIQAHALGWDISIVPPANMISAASTSTETLVKVFGEVLGWAEVENVYLYKELGGRELVMRRKVDAEGGGGTSWEPSPLVEGSWAGKLVHLAGLDAIGATAGSLARFVQDRELELWEHKRIVSHISPGERETHSTTLSTTHPSFRLVCTSTKSLPLKDWLTDEHSNMFFTIPSIPMDEEEEFMILLATGCPIHIVNILLEFADKYRSLILGGAVAAGGSAGSSSGRTRGADVDMLIREASGKAGIKVQPGDTRALTSLEFNIVDETVPPKQTTSGPKATSAKKGLLRAKKTGSVTKWKHNNDHGVGLRHRKLGTRTLVRIARRMAFFYDKLMEEIGPATANEGEVDNQQERNPVSNSDPDEEDTHIGGGGIGDLKMVLSRMLLLEFLPPTERMTIEDLMDEVGIWDMPPTYHPDPVVQDDILTFPSNSSSSSSPFRLHDSDSDSGSDMHDITFATTIPRFNVSLDPEGSASYVPSMSHFYNNSLQTGLMRELAVDLEVLGEHVVLLGNQGVGKNKIVDRLCQLLGRPREYVQLHRDTTVNQLLFTTTLQNGVVQYTDSPLLRAIAHGRIIIIDEADKAPEHVVAVFKSLGGQGELSLPDGRKVRMRKSENDVGGNKGDVVMHPGFRLVLLANRPGYPFLGNHFLQVLGENFSIHSVSNPDQDSERKILSQLAPELGDDLIARLVGAFQDLRKGYESGALGYPYSLRELINLTRHLQAYPKDPLGSALRNIFDFDVYKQETIDKLAEILDRHGLHVPNLGLTAARESAKSIEDIEFEPSNNDLDKPKEGEHDNEEHTGGNKWAGGTGGRDTAGAGGRGGYKRFIKPGTTSIKQVSDSLKDSVPDHIKEQAREMARQELQRRLEELDMKESEAKGYGKLMENIGGHLMGLRDLMEHLAAKEEERVWVKRQTDGELDDSRLTEGLTGESAVYKRRGMEKPELGRPQIKPKRIRFIFDLSASMYRFQHDGRLQRSLEAAAMLMETFNRITRKDKFVWDMYGHSGDGPDIALVTTDKPPTELKERWKIIEKMYMIPQYAFAGDFTVEAILKGVQEVGKYDADDWFVVAITDANFSRYQISPEELTRAMNHNPKVNTALICIGEGAEATWIPKSLPGRGFRVKNTGDIPVVLRSILNTMVSGR